MDQAPKQFLIGQRGRQQSGTLRKQIQKVVGTDTDNL